MKSTTVRQLGSSSTTQNGQEFDNNENDATTARLWFTTTVSNELLGAGTSGKSSMAGLYSCAFNKRTGTCQDDNPPQVVLDSWYHNTNVVHHDMKLSNVQLVVAQVQDGGEEETPTPTQSAAIVYARTHDIQRNSFEIIKATINDPKQLSTGKPPYFVPYFRTQSKFDYDDCGFQCCEGSRESYVQVTPKTFTVINDGDDDDDDDDNEIYIVWDGFYQNCLNPIIRSKKQNNLLWTIGISKLKQYDPHCLINVLNNNNDDDDEGNGLSAKEDWDVSFVDCTEVVAIAYQNENGRDRVATYGGFTAVKTTTTTTTTAGGTTQPQVVFFLSILHSTGIDTGRFTSEMLVFAEGAHFSKDATSVQGFGQVPIDMHFFDQPIEDVGTIKVHTKTTNNNNNEPDYVCRTVYDEGVFCFPIEYNSETGKIAVSGPALDFVTPSQIRDICTLHIDPPTYQHTTMKGVSTTVTTGLEVIWGNTDGDSSTSGVVPEMVIFGCYGEINTKGNLTTVHRDGTIVQTIRGAYPGSILFGVDVLNSATKPKAIEPPPKEDSNGFRGQRYSNDASSSSTSSGGILDTMSTLRLFLGMILVALATVMIKKRKGRTVAISGNGLSHQQEGSGGNYIELPTVSFDEDRNDANGV